MAVTAAVDIANIALSRLGEATITTLTAAGRNAEIVNELYGDDRNYCLMLFDWSCLTHRQTLARSGKFTITAATAANPVVLTTSATHTLLANELLTVESVSGMTDLNGGVFRIFSLTSTTITLYDTTGATLNGTSYTAYTSGGFTYRWPGADWEWVYDLPSDCLRVLNLLDEEFGFDPTYTWRKERDFIFTDIENAGVQYTRADTDVTVYEEELIELIATRLAWHCSRRINGLAPYEQMMHQDYSEALARAKVANARGQQDEGEPPILWTSVR